MALVRIVIQTRMAAFILLLFLLGIAGCSGEDAREAPRPDLSGSIDPSHRNDPSSPAVGHPSSAQDLGDASRRIIVSVDAQEGGPREARADVVGVEEARLAIQGNVPWNSCWALRGHGELRGSELIIRIRGDVRPEFSSNADCVGFVGSGQTYHARTEPLALGTYELIVEHAVSRPRQWFGGVDSVSVVTVLEQEIEVGVGGEAVR